MGYKNIEDAKAQRRRYYLANKDKPGKWKDADGKWIQQDPEKRRIRYQKYLEKNRERINQYQRDRAAKLKRVGECPICLKPDQHLYYDHCHETNQFRDYICTHCNLLLGHSYDNQETLTRARDYLAKHSNRSKT